MMKNHLRPSLAAQVPSAATLGRVYEDRPQRILLAKGGPVLLQTFQLHHASDRQYTHGAITMQPAQ